MGLLLNEYYHSQGILSQNYNSPKCLKVGISLLFDGCDEAGTVSTLNVGWLIVAIDR